MRRYSFCTAALAVMLGATILEPAVAQTPAAPLAASDTHTQFSTDGTRWAPAVPTLTYRDWPTLAGATWVWRSAAVAPDEALRGSGIVTFRRAFDWHGAAGVPATIQIDADNAYELLFNGARIGGKGRLDASSNEDVLWRSLDRYPVSLVPGKNEILIRAINYHWSHGGTPSAQDNPAGIVFRVDVVHEDAATIAKALEDTGTFDVHGILFDLDKADIKPESKATLDEVAKLLKADPALTLEVAGHTDSTGGAKHNMALSKARADAVKRALVTQYGIDPNRLHARGYGDTKPVAPNDTESNRAKNRRVELRKL